MQQLSRQIHCSISDIKTFCGGHRKPCKHDITNRDHEKKWGKTKETIEGSITYFHVIQIQFLP